MTAGRALTARTAVVTVALQLTARAASLVLAAASTAIVTRAVGVDRYADWATALTVVTMLAFVMDPGMTPVVVRRLVQDPANCPSLRAMLIVRLVPGAAGVLITAAVLWALRGADAIPVGAVLAAQLLPRAALLNAGAVLQLDHRQHRQAFAETGFAALGVIALLIAKSAGASPAVLAAVGITGPLVLMAICAEMLSVRSPSAARVVPGDDRPRVVSLLREVAPLAIALMLFSLYTRIQVVFVNAADDSGSVARYLLAFLVVEQLMVLGGIAGAAMMPFFADRAKGGSLFADDLTQTVLVALVTVGAVATAAILLLAHPVVEVLGGDGFGATTRYLRLLSPMAPATLLAVSLGYVYTSTGTAGRYLRFNGLGFALSVMLNTVFTLSDGAQAAARVTWITEFAVMAYALLAIARAGGEAAVARIAGMGAACAVAAELVDRGLAPAAGAAALTVVAAVLGGKPIVALVRTRLLTSGPTDTP